MGRDPDQEASRWRFDRFEGDGKLTRRVDDAEGEAAFEYIEQVLAAKPASPSLKERGRLLVIPPIEMPANQLFEIGDVGHHRTGDLFLCTALRQRRGQQVSQGREAGRLLQPWGKSGSDSSGTARACPGSSESPDSGSGARAG